MELNDIQKLMQSFNDTGLSRLQYTHGTESLVLEKGISGSFAASPQLVPAPLFHDVPASFHQSEAPSPVSMQAAIKSVTEVENTIKAPMVGVFYLAPSPDASPYVQIGQAVSKGQTLCILEAMKVLNEIQAEWDGIVESVLAQPEDIVEYGQPLFLIRRA